MALSLLAISNRLIVFCPVSPNTLHSPSLHYFIPATRWIPFLVSLSRRHQSVGLYSYRILRIATLRRFGRPLGELS